MPTKIASPHRLSRPIPLVVLGLLAVTSPARARQADSAAVVARVADAVCEKQVVILGELPSHGEARAFQAKAEIVQPLIDRCGFDAGYVERQRGAPAPLDGRLAALGFTAYVPWAFLNAPALRSIGHAPCLFGSFTAADWATYFDGVVVIREEVAPTFDP